MTDELILAELRAIRALLERKAPRDERHDVLVQAIAVAANGAAFSVSELLAHAQVSESLRSSILASCGELNGRKLGRLLRRIEGAEVQRCGEDSSGVIWIVKPRKARLSIA